MEFKKEFNEELNEIFINRLLETINSNIDQIKKNNSQQNDVILKDSVVDTEEIKASSDDEIKKRLTADIIYRQEKTKKAYEALDVVETKINTFSKVLEQQLKDFDKSVYIGNDPILVKAVRQVFKKNLKYINKSMYLEACKKMQELLTNTVEIK